MSSNTSGIKLLPFDSPLVRDLKGAKPIWDGTKTITIKQVKKL